MTIITKAALAAELKVTKPRVSQYVKAGLPVRPDGKLDRETVLHWVSMNCRSGADHRKGPSRAREIQPPVRESARVLGDIEAATRARLDLARDVVFGVMSIACDLDLPAKVVFALTKNMHGYLQDCVDIERFEEFEDIIRDWGSIARGQGEEPDFEAWEAYRAEMYEKAGD